jgi:hypothetical protein
VEMDVVRGHPVHAALGVGEAAEDLDRRRPDARGQVRRSDQGADVRPRAVRMVRRTALHVGPECAQPGPRHGARPDGDLVRDDRGHGGPDRVEGRAGVEQGPEQHVAGDARGRVDPQIHGRNRKARGPRPRLRPRSARRTLSSIIIGLVRADRCSAARKVP